MPGGPVREDEAHVRYLGMGVYEIPEAARLTGLSSARLRRWFGGHRSGPLWQLDFPRVGGRIGLSFLDLVQAYVAAELLGHGLPVRALRPLLEKAKTVLETEHPFASARFRTDGRRLYLEILEEKPRLLDLGRDQFAFHRVIAPSLKPLEYDTHEMASRWWPLGRNRSVVLDRHRRFGKPITAKSGVPTEVLFQQYKVMNSVEKVAEAFEIDEREVKDAIEFERRLENRARCHRRAA